MALQLKLDAKHFWSLEGALGYLEGQSWACPKICTPPSNCKCSGCEGVGAKRETVKFKKAANVVVKGTSYPV